MSDEGGVAKEDPHGAENLQRYAAAPRRARRLDMSVELWKSACGNEGGKVARLPLLRRGIRLERLAGLPLSAPSVAVLFAWHAWHQERMLGLS